MKKRYAMMVCLSGFLGFGMLVPENAAAVEGKCVAFCDEPSASEDASDFLSTYTPPSYTAPRESPNRTQTQYYNNEGLKARKRGDYHGAIALYQQGLAYAHGYARAAEDARLLTENIGAAHAYLGWEAYDRGDYPEAIRLFRLGLAAEPSSKTHQENLAKAMRKAAEAAAAPLAMPPGNHEIINPLPIYAQGDAFSAPVDLRDKAAGGGELPVVDPKMIQGETSAQPKTLKTRDVPLPPSLQKLNASEAFRHDIYDGFEDHADMVLDALEKGEGDLDKSITYLEERVNTEGQGIVGTDALSYLEGLKIGAIAHDADTPPDVFKDKELAQELIGAPAMNAEAAFEEGVLEAAAKMLEEQAAKHGFENWRVSRTKMMLYALEEGRGDLEKSMGYLDRERQNLLSPSRQEADNANNYLRGLHAYSAE